MRYVGSKRRHAKEILPIILKNRKPNQLYVELFVGSCGTMDKVKDPRLGNDNHYYLIEMWKALQNGWLPPKSISYEEYQNIRYNKHLYPAELVGFVGFACSFGGRWWEGYARGKNNGKERNYCMEGYNAIVKQIPLIKNVTFTCNDYSKVEFPPNSIIYLDPPYNKTKKYSSSKNFDYNMFWQFVRKISDENEVFISEYTAPDDFECLWSKNVYNTLRLNTAEKQGIERLFKIKK